jgi:transposase
VGVTVQDASAGDTTTMVETLITAAEQVDAVGAAGITEVVGDKGYHSNETMEAFVDLGVRSYVSEPDRGRRNWKGKAVARTAVYANRRRIRGAPAGNSCCGSAASSWNGPTPISTRPAGCAACICASIRIS